MIITTWAVGPIESSCLIRTRAELAPRGTRRQTGLNLDAVSDDGFLVDVDAATIKRERAKARALRASSWWQRRCAAGVCHYCGQQVGAALLTMDHLVPIIRGGRSTKGNCVPACRACNAAKRHRLAFEFTPE